MMETVKIENITSNVEIIPVDDIAMFLNLMYHDLVDIILEYITIFTDDEMIQEIINILDLNITCVVDHGAPIGYITPAGVKA